MENRFLLNNKWAIYSVLALLVLVTFLPGLQSSFVNFDDNVNIYENPQVASVESWGDIAGNSKKIFSTHVIGNYNPLTILTFAVEKKVFGFNKPGLWHLDNIILHIICVILVFEISLSLGLEIIPAIFCAILFGVQPMRVESVAWLTERKDVLYSAFYLAALYCYIKYVRLDYRLRYLAYASVLFLFSLFSKIQAVTLPLSMLLVDYLLDRKFSLRLIYEKTGFFLLSLLFGVIGLYFLKIQNSLTPTMNYVFSKKLLVGAYSYISYLLKALLPYEMLPLRPFPYTFSWVYYLFLVLSLLVLGAIAVFYLKRNKELVFGLLFFTFNIMFLLQIKVSGKAFMADRFTYIAYFGIFFIYSFGMQTVLEKYAHYSRQVLAAVLVVLLVYGGITFNQTKIWTNGGTLWSEVLRYYPDYLQALTGRAEYYSDTGQQDKAIADYSRFLAINRRQPVVYYRRGMLYAEKNDPLSLKRAIDDFTSAIKYGESDKLYLAGRGRVYQKLGMTDQALLDFKSAQALTRY